ncbi:MAG: endonuclease III [Oscillospiraceae bacterium]|nr:endonuclease III [Oscillospiraceae bacterium]
MTKKQTALILTEKLRTLYPQAVCGLRYTKPYELIIAARLSAQCTDARVNIVTLPLFERFDSLESFANADISEVEEFVKSCGLYKTKARDIVALCAALSELGGRIPDSIDELLTLPGIGRKTANLIMGDIHGKPAIVADTHCIRISGRLGLCNTADPKKVETALKKLIPPEESNDFCHRLVLFGRDICRARNPDCGNCPIKEYCRWKKHTMQL